MRAACEFNNVTTTAATTATTTAAAAAAIAVNLNSSNEQILLPNVVMKQHNTTIINSSNSTNISNNSDMNYAEKNGHTNSNSNDDLFMSASSSTTDFNGKVTATPITAATTIHILRDASDILSATPSSSPNKLRTIIVGPKQQQQQQQTSSILQSSTVLNNRQSSKIGITPVETKTTVSAKTNSIELMAAATTNPLNCSNSSADILSNSIISPSIYPRIGSSSSSCSSSSILNNNSKNNSSGLITQASPSKTSVIESTVPAASVISSSSSSSMHQAVVPLSTTSKSTAVSSTSSSSSLFERIEFEDLLQWKDMPRHLQFNPYVLTGYRPLSSVKGCFFSLFYWHNETINILTHGIPIVYILATVPSLMPWEKDFRFLSFCHIFGAVAPWCGSFVYHLFMNLERGENIYYRLLKIDMVGIWISQSFGALPMVTASVYCFGFKMKWFMIIGYCILSLWGLYKALNATSPWQRRLCFALPFTMRVFLTLFRTLRWVGGNPQALTHVYLQDLVSVFGGAIGAMHIPEKWFPGSVDLYLNSHNIMHVLVVVAVYSMHSATVSDFEWMSKTECNNNFYNSTMTIDNSMNEHFEL